MGPAQSLDNGSRGGGGGEGEPLLNVQGPKVDLSPYGSASRRSVHMDNTRRGEHGVVY